MSILLLFIIAVCLFVYAFNVSRRNQEKTSKYQTSETPTHFDLLDDNGDPISAPKMKIVIGGDDSDAPVQELQYFCIKDKGYHVTVWPKDYNHFDMVRFNIAGIEYRDNINSYLGEFQGTLEAEPTNPYDKNAIKVLAPDGHHVGYVPKDMTAEVRAFKQLPCKCYCYIGINNGIYYTDCYVIKKS